MSLFPAYDKTAGGEKDIKEEIIKETPSWLKNTSFKKFEQRAKSRSTSSSSSRSSRYALKVPWFQYIKPAVYIYFYKYRM
jgi:hypothetical protein